MLGFVIRRLLVAALLLLAASFLTFMMIQLAPGDYLAQLRMNPQIGDDVVEQMAERYGLNDPVLVQYGRWLGNLARGDMGFSFVHERPVAELVWEHLRNTIFLMTMVILVTWLMALPMGIYCAIKQNRLTDRVLSALAFVGLSIPNFFLCLVVMWLAAEIGGIPVGGMTSAHYEYLSWGGKVVDVALHMAIPVLVIATGAMAGLQRVTRGNMLEVLRQQYVTTARARGLPEHRVIYVHALRNAINPLITIFGYQFALLVSGAALVEIIYSWPGMGQLILEAVLTQDLYLVVGVVLGSGLMLILGNLLADILLGVNDPRIKFGERGAS